MKKRKESYIKKHKRTTFIICVFAGLFFVGYPVWAYERDTDSLSENTIREESEIEIGQENLTAADTAFEGRTLQDFVKRMYTVVLERDAEEEGLSYWTSQLKEQSADGASLAAGFICSREFTDKRLDYEKYIDVLYRTFFGREADEEGRQYWLGILRRGAPGTEVLSGFVNSKEFSQLCAEYGIARGTMEPDGSSIYNAGVREFVLRLYTQALGREGDPEGVESWCYAINKGMISAQDCARNFFYSREFTDKNLNEDEYVNVLYRTFFGREADEEGRAYWVMKLKEGTGRDALLDEFAASKEFRKILASYGLQTFISYLSPSPAVQPFMNSALSDCSMRIPSVVSLNDGTIVAAADARWDALYDGGGLDTVASVSRDLGSSWRCSFANYLGDNGNFFNNESTSFLDPALATDGDTVYMLVNLYPAGYSFYGTSHRFYNTGVAFDSLGRLLLREKGSYSFDYFLQDGMIYHYTGKRAEGYVVDEYFNIRGNGVDSNLFFLEDSPYSVYPTTYLYFTKSTDGGNTWSAPELLQVKRSEEQGYTVGCGTGTVLSDGTIVYCCYSTMGVKQLASFIFSKDGGKSWGRSDFATDVGNWSSEGSVVELDENHLRMFYRDSGSVISYADFTLIKGCWKISGHGSLSGILKTAGNRLHVIKYDEHTLLISMAASGTDERKTGVIATVKLNDACQMRVSGLCYVNGNDYFGYSCMAKLKDGSVGLLYESHTSGAPYQILYRKISQQDLDL